ncbi:uncharacterized domain 1-containing protein [Cognatiyoonia koreensis]|uniref:Medium/long-chain acyl-CoA thioesterase YigI n=1 Tax=Cognatiyoonia koreensis TaxID=364200 RepID=A0A1I0MKE3_9RHOB|nr:PaaI family thioesterase [Cognatiyoonia koreensis]SEV88868.1 uncharacterized domain 1-containing protein [Cognatiyoonia koreensis]
MDVLDPDAIARLRAGFEAQAVMRTLGAEIDEIRAGRVVLTMPFRTDLTQQHGFMHAGIITTVLDSACGFAAFTLMDEGAEVLTAEFKSSFVAPARGNTFRFEGDVIKSGRTLTFTEGMAFGIADGQDTLVATMSATMMAVRNRPGVNALHVIPGLQP